MSNKRTFQYMAAGLPCTALTESFVLQDGPSNLWPNDTGLFAKSVYLHTNHYKPIEHHGFERFVTDCPVNFAGNSVLKQLSSKLDAVGVWTILVVSSGRQLDWLDSLLLAVQAPQAGHCNIDSGADVDFSYAGLDSPFANAAFDAVVTTAILKQMLYPERLAAEITRVLKPVGLFCAAPLLMQQVHVGSHDFMHCPLSRLRYTFNHFARLVAGLVAKPATVFVWAIEKLALAFVAQPALRKLARLAVRVGAGWIKHLNHWLAHTSQVMNNAQCPYFYGCKALVRVADVDIITRYVGFKGLQHV